MIFFSNLKKSFQKLSEISDEYDFSYLSLMIWNEFILKCTKRLGNFSKLKLRQCKFLTYLIVFQGKMTLSNKNGSLPVIVAAPNRQSPLKSSGPSMALVNASLAGDILRKLQAKNAAANKNNNDATSSKSGPSTAITNEALFNNSSGNKNSTSNSVSRPSVIIDGSSMSSQSTLSNNVSSAFSTVIKAPPVPSSQNLHHNQNLISAQPHMTQPWISGDASHYVPVQGLETVFDTSAMPSDNVIVEELVEGTDAWGRYGGEIYLEGQQPSSSYNSAQFENPAFFINNTEGQVLASGNLVDLPSSSVFEETFRNDAGSSSSYLFNRNLEDHLSTPSKRRRVSSNNEFNLKEFFKEDADTSEDERTGMKFSVLQFFTAEI